MQRPLLSKYMTSSQGSFTSRDFKPQFADLGKEMALQGKPATNYLSRAIDKQLLKVSASLEKLRPKEPTAVQGISSGSAKVGADGLFNFVDMAKSS